MVGRTPGRITRSDTGSAFTGSESRVVAAAKTAAALATKLDRVAGAAEARAIRALLRPATMTLEGAAAQPWVAREETGVHARTSRRGRRTSTRGRNRWTRRRRDSPALNRATCPGRG